MQGGFRTLFCGFLVTLALFCSSASGSDLSVFLHSAFDDHHGRPPTGAEMNYYTNISRTEGPLEAYIRMVSSDYYFVTQCQRNDEVFVTRLYQVFLHRDPRPDELRFWLAQYLQNKNAGRTVFVRQFCLANNVQLVPSVPSPSQLVALPPSGVSNAQATAAGALVTKVDLLRTLVQREMGGTTFGRTLLDTVASLLTTSMQYRDLVNAPQTTDQQLQVAATNLERVLRSVESQFRTVPAASAQIQNLLWEISQLVTAARPQAPVASTRPVASNPVLASADQLSLLVRQYVSILSPYQNQSAFYTSLFRDVNGLFVQVESLRQLARKGAPQSDLQRVVNSISSQARTIGHQTRQADAGFQQGWWNIQHELDRLTTAAGCAGDLYATVDHPVVINRPAWTEFPAQVSPDYRVSSVNKQVVALSDQLISLLDDYVNSLRPIASRTREANELVQQTLDIRHAVLVLRQQGAVGSFGSTLQYSSREVTRLYRDVASQTFLTMVGRDSTLNSPVWMQIGQLAYQIDKVVSGTQ